MPTTGLSLHKRPRYSFLRFWSKKARDVRTVCEAPVFCICFSLLTSWAGTADRCRHKN